MLKINIIEYFEDTVKKFPNLTAVTDGENSLSFAELASKAVNLANIIKDKVQKINTPVAVFLPKSIDAVVSDMAITYSGNAYMNLDVKNPLERLSNIISLVKPSAIITNSKYASIIDALDPKDIPVILIENVTKEENGVTKSCEEWKKLIDTDPYCIINTSGSTGTPKGVVLNHRSFIDFMEQTFDEYEFSEKDSIGSLSPTVFDIWSYELCMLAGVGSRIVIIPDSFSAFPMKILELIKAQKVTYLFWVPTIMVNIANMNLLESIKLPDLRIIWFAGEVFPTKQFNIWYKALPHVKFSNFYGPIEITLDCVYYNIDKPIPDDKPIPIGKPFRNTGILLLDDNNNLVEEPFVEGEICVRGSSLAMGYYNNHAKTEIAFVQNPLNTSYNDIIYRTGDVASYNEEGNLIFKGRRDTLIKHLGYRMELGEIEHVIINTLKIVQNCCVIYNKAKKEITVYYESPNIVEPSNFRRELGNILPKYMIPTVYIHEVEMKRNTNGKIDRLYYNNLING